MAMDFRATKTHGEQEDEETGRLVHRAPKYKPPRHDRRRERVETGRDPDIEGDPDLKSDPDLSMNYKNIGGSFTHAIVAARFLAAKGQMVTVRHRETGKVVNVSEDTLREEGGKYEKIEDAEQGKGEGSDNPEVAKRGDALREMAKGDENLQGAFKQLLNPKSDLGGLAKENPKLPAKAIFKNLKLPEGVETVGDLVEALRSKPSSKGKPKEKEPEPSKEESPPTSPPEAKAQTSPGTKPNEGAPRADSPASDTPGNTPESGGEGASKEEKDKPKEKGKGKEKDKPKKDKGKKKGPGEDEGPDQEEPSEAEKAGIKPPQRREASEAERMEAANLIMDSFPEHIATDLLAKNLHPDDVGQLVNTYHATKQLVAKDPAAFAERAANFYEPNFDRVRPPAKGKNAAGETVPFKELTPEEQSEAMRQHQVQVAALSLGAKEALTHSLSMPTGGGKPQVAPSLAGALATFMLTKGDEKAASKMADQMFSTALTGDSSWARTDEKAAKQLFERLTPAARKLASSYFQAADYHEAKSRFLGGGEEQVSEFSRPADIVGSLKKAHQFFADRAKAYGEDQHRGQAVFQVRVLDRLRALQPEKYGAVRQLIAKEQKGDYDRAKAAYDKELKGWEDRKGEWENKQTYRSKPFGEPKPTEPKKPPLYHLAEEPKQARRQAEAALDEVLGRTKTAASVARRFIFTYPGPHAMGHGSDKTGVYHGIDPLKNYPKPYVEWQQAHQRDLGETDYTTLLGSAKEWLKSSMLSVAVEGITKDQQLRAALDLAIRDSKYDGQIQPTVYNNLLARLAGVPAPGLGQTLLTIREANSSFGTSKKGTTTMKPSHELRKLATKAADIDPKLAFEMVELAERIEQAPAPALAPAAETKTASAPDDERYGKLRTLVIRMAAVDAGAKKVLMPVLQEIKNLG